MTEEGRQEDETPKERADRELIELLNELRVVLPGVTVLLAFLLAVLGSVIHRRTVAT